ncbi:beta-N-acetylhexosaminidase family protein, partial [Hymenobacter agri]
MNWKPLVSLAALLSLSGAPAHAQSTSVGPPAISIIPQPARVLAGSGAFVLTPDTKIYVGPKNEELRRIGQRLSQAIGRATGTAP